jgi:fucose permease
VSRGAQELAPAPAPPQIRAAWVSYAYLSAWAFGLYGLGVATPYIRADLHLTDFQAGLHGSALAVGMLAAGISADWMGRWIGPAWLRDVAAAVIVAAIALVVLAPALPVSLAGAFLLGLGGGTLGTDVNIRLGRSGGMVSRRLMNQANGLAIGAAVTAPLAIGLAASALNAWRIALVIPIAMLAVLTVVRPRGPETSDSVRLPRSRLPRGYWIAWLLVVLCVSIEFSFVFWGSTLVGKKTGISSADATLLASLFVTGMLVGRLAAGTSFGASRAPRTVLGAGLGMILIGASLTWMSTVPVMSAIGLFLGGLGTAALYPVGITVALQNAPGAHLEAAARLTLASGVAVLLAPSILGLASDVVGVVAAWPIILALAVAALLVLAVTPRTSHGQ